MDFDLRLPSPVNRPAIRIALFALCLGGLGLAQRAVADAPSPAPPTTVVDLEGRPVDPFRQSQGHIMALVFVRSDCPIANSYAPVLGELQQRYTKRGVAFWLVYVDPDDGPEVIRKHLQDYHLPATAIRDPKLALAKRAHAQVTPECAVFDSAGELLYHGRIDDRWADLGVKRPEATRHDLALALDAALAGRKPQPAATSAIGCYISNAP